MPASAITVADAPARCRSTSAVTRSHSRGEVEVVGTIGGLVRDGDASRIRSTRYVRSAPSTAPSRYQCSCLCTRPHGSTTRSVGLPVPRGVPQAHASTLHDRGLEHGQQFGALGRRTPPLAGVDHDRLGGSGGIRSEALGQGSHELAQRRLRVGVDGCRGPHEQEQRPRLGAGEPAEIGARTAEQLPAATTTGLRIHGDAGRRQCLEVSTRGRHRDLELLGELRGGHPAARLQREEGGDEAVCAHVSDSPRKSSQRVSTSVFDN